MDEFEPLNLQPHPVDITSGEPHPNHYATAAARKPHRGLTVPLKPDTRSLRASGGEAFERRWEMRRIVVLSVALLLMLGMMAGSAFADPPVTHEPLGPGFAHSHHVHTGNGDCVDIDSVYFNVDVRGLHQGANASRGPLQGPFHGTCDDRIFPGGPPVPFGPHH